MLISGGENIYPSEIERILSEHPHVDECAVIGIPDEKWGEVPVAALVCSDAGSPDDAELLQLFEGRLGRLKYPRHFVRLDVLPRNAMGKVVFSELKASILEILESQGVTDFCRSDSSCTR
jgi:fatty-acyl-CoA synthase